MSDFSQMKYGTNGAAVSINQNQEDAQDGNDGLQVEVVVEKETNERFRTSLTGS